MKNPKYFLLTLLILPLFNLAQVDTVLFSEKATHLFPAFPYKTSYTSIIDRRGIDFLYSANMEFGLGIYDIADTSQIVPVLNIPIADFDSLDVSNIKQRNNSLFAGIGDFQVNTNRASGLAILDISNPASPIFKDIWDTVAFTHGVSHILIEGDYAYLSIMTDGIIILDISDENNIQFVSYLQLDLNFPSPSSNAHNSRGLKIRNDTLYVCFDRGGLRLVDVSDKYSPQEIYKYININLNSTAAAAYNDVFLIDNYAFMSVDYCGLEIVDIGSIPFTNVQWYNPWGCNTVNWSGADLHFNEIKTSNNDSLLFVSAGQSEVFLFDVSSPSNTVLKGAMANPNDSVATYGLDVYGEKVSLSLVNTPFHVPPFTPFFGRPGGLKLLSYSVLNGTGINSRTSELNNLTVYPNPVRKNLFIESENSIKEVNLLDLFGRLLYSGTQAGENKSAELNFSNYPSGTYFLRIHTKKGIQSRRIFVQN